MVQVLKEGTNLLFSWSFSIPANFIFASCKFSRCLDWPSAYCLGYFFIWISRMQNMLLLLSFTMSCQWLKLGKEQWHNKNRRRNSLSSAFCLYFSSVYLYTEKRNVCMYSWERDILICDSEGYAEITVGINTPREEKYICTANQQVHYYECSSFHKMVFSFNPIFSSVACWKYEVNLAVRKTK